MGSELVKVEAAEPSEFGRGLVVCLVKFSEHLSSKWAQAVAAHIYWQELDDEHRAKALAEARKFPVGDMAQRLSLLKIGEWSEHPLSECLRMWANGASDHFYELDASASKPLKELAALTLRMGHGFDGTVWTVEDWQRMWKLWQEATLELDRRLGITPDWGQW